MSRLERIKPDELEILIEHARSEQWTELALIGPDVELAESPETWPAALTAFQCVRQITGHVEDLAARLRPLTTLRSLTVWANRIGAAGAQHLAALERLISLDLWGNQIGDAGVQHLAALENLTSLNLSFNRIGDAGAQHLSALKNLTSLRLYKNKICEAGAQHLAALKNLTSLDVRSNDIGAAGAQHLAALKNLTSLDLRNNEIGETGARHVSVLAKLTWLDLSSNQIGEAGAKHLAKLRNLASLQLYGNDIGDAGVQHLAVLEKLESLDLWDNQIGDSGAQHLAKLKNLTSLDLSFNRVGEAGAQHLAALENLMSLDLSSNEIGDAGAQHLAKLENLTSLRLYKNEIGDAGAEQLSELGNLTSLDLPSNEIGDAGAQHLAALENLISLDLSSNEIGDLGAQHLAALENLTSLGLSSNQIGKVGAQYLAVLKKLNSLDLSSNEIGDAGAQHLAELENLTLLGLSSNEIGDAGAQHLEMLEKLTSLDLSSNEIGDVGAQHLAKLENLTSLRLSFNKIGEKGAQHLASLGRLKSLDLSSNEIGDAGAQHLAALEKLKSLDLSSNEIGDAGAQHLAKLKNLTSLDLSFNSVGDAGAQHLAALESLTLLNLSNTCVTDLSTLLPLIKKGTPVVWSSVGDGVLLAGCPLTRPPPVVVKQGNAAVLNYFDEIDAQGKARLYEAKMLLVGEGGAGKTSLLRRLYNSGQSLPTPGETTKGIEIRSHEFHTPEGNTFRLNVWDFGGQEIYHSTHQIFLTKRSLYVLVDDTRKNDTTVHDPGFKYWLEVIDLLSEHSPVFIFQNEKGGRSKAIDEAGIKGLFPNVKDVYRGDLKKAHAADGFREAIELAVQQLPHIGDEVPARWVPIRAEIETRAQQEPYISDEAYFEIYGRHLKLDRVKARHLSRYLHDLGVFLHFQDHELLQRTIILQNEWATRAVFRILDHEQTKKRYGRFTRDVCKKLWSEQSYSDMSFELLALMENFELCYRLPDEPHTWLAPQLLPPSMPDELLEWGVAGDLVLSYRYEFLPKGLISRLMVRMHRFVRRPELAWANGVLFEHDDTQLLVQAAPRGNEIVLRTRGAEKKALLSVIASDMDALNARFGGSKDKVTKRVPCVCTQCVNSAKPEFFEQKKLLRRKKHGKISVECPDSFEDVSVLTLLDGLVTGRLPAWTDESKVQRTIRIFLASSSELAEHRDAFDLYFRQRNDDLRKRGIYLEIVRWENFLDAMSETGLQNEYNKEIGACDVFVCLFRTKTGKFTEEEFDVAHHTFEETGKPRIFTFFENADIKPGSVDRSAMQSLWDFQDKLKQLGHYRTQYEGIEHLKRQFSDQLTKLFEAE